MQITTLLSNSEVKLACAEYIEKHGIMGAVTESNQIVFQHHGGVIQATLTLPSKKDSSESLRTKLPLLSHVETESSISELTLMSSKEKPQLEEEIVPEVPLPLQEKQPPVSTTSQQSGEGSLAITSTPTQTPDKKLTKTSKLFTV